MWALLWSAAFAQSSGAEIVAWSDAGDAVLIRAQAQGEEGGGSLQYGLIRLTETGAAMVSAELSNDMSPGDGSTPEHLSVSDCKEAAKRLAAAAIGFTGLEVSAAACARDRYAVVRYAGAAPIVRPDHAPAGLPEGRWSEGGGPLLVTLGGDGLELWRKVEAGWEPARKAAPAR